MADATKPGSDLSAVPLFPLPNVVLFPRAVIPLHIFEERYKAMTAHALAGDRQIAMALLKTGWEKNYYATPPIDRVVCVGTILTHERLEDGCYNFLLQGLSRARVVREVEKQAFRIAELQLLVERPALEIDLEAQRRRLAEIFGQRSILATGIGRQFRHLLNGPLPTADIADLVAFNFLEDVSLKQTLLSEADVRSRVGQIVDAFEASCSSLIPAFGTVQDPSLN